MKVGDRFRQILALPILCKKVKEIRRKSKKEGKFNKKEKTKSAVIIRKLYYTTSSGRRVHFHLKIIILE